jgi:hypothetical protein
MSTTATLDKPATETTRPEFGNGRYSAEMGKIYDNLQKLFGIEPAKAEKIARQAGSDAGAIFRLTDATIRVSKANSDNKGTIADASKAKNVTLTNALNIVHAIQWCGDAGKHGIAYGHTDWQLCEALQKYVDQV